MIAHGAPDPCDSASKLRAALLRREFSARELLAATLALIERLNPALNAVIYKNAAAASRAAAVADERIMQGKARPLEGLPITIKDCFEVAGMPACAGAPALKDYLPRQDAVAVAKLREAGAIIIGKTNVPILAGDFQTFNGLFGVTGNPWDKACSPGGSSGGAAVAVATGMSAFELGSDLAGSIRWPAHCCGIFGLKTTWNLISTYGHIPPVPQMRLERNPDLTVAGPLARSAADLGLVLDVLAGPSAAAQKTQMLIPARRISPKGLRVALWCDEPCAPVDATVAAAVLEAARMLEREGAIIDPSLRPSFSFAEAFEIFAVLAHALIGAGLPDKVRERLAGGRQDFLPGDLSHRALQARGMGLTGAELIALQARRQRIREAWARFFQSCDIVLCPPASTGAIPHDQRHDPHTRTIAVNGEARPYFDLMLWACLASCTGLPAAVAPVAIAPDGLPRGVQIIAAPFEDKTAIACAAMIEALGAGFRPPTMALY